MQKEILTTEEKMVVMTLFNLAIEQAMVFCNDHEPEFFKDQLLQQSITNDLEDRVKIMNIFDFVEKFQNVICPSKEQVELLHEACEKLVKKNKLSEVSIDAFSFHKS